MAAAFDISAKVGPVIAELGYIPAILPAAIGARNYDTMDHHRRSVLKHQEFPAKRRAQRMLATRLHRFGQTKTPPDRLEQASGESFAAIESAKPGHDYGDDFFTNVEVGRVITTPRPMLIGAGGGDFAPPGFVIVGKGVVVRADAQGRPKLSRATKTKGARVDIVGFLRRRRRQPKMLHFYRQWSLVEPRALAKYEADLAKVLTVAGQESLKERIAGEQAKAAAYRGEYDKFLRINPGNHAGARRAAGTVANAVKRDALGRGKA